MSEHEEMAFEKRYEESRNRIEKELKKNSKNFGEVEKTNAYNDRRGLI